MAKISNYKFQLRGTLIIGGSSVSISNDLETEQEVVFTDEAVLLYNRDKTIIERVRASATGGTLTLIKRGMEHDSETEDPTLEKEWREGSFGAMTIFAPQIVDQIADNTLTGANEFTGDVTMSGSFRDPVYADATARDAAITSPVNGMKIYNTALGLFQKYQAGVWTDDTAGGATPNGSETVAGKVEIATDAQFTAGDEVGETGAILVAHPGQIKSKNDLQDTAISTNTADIATNTADIATNTADIATIETDISNGVMLSNVVTGNITSTGSTAIPHGLLGTPSQLVVFGSDIGDAGKPFNGMYSDSISRCISIQNSGQQYHTSFMQYSISNTYIVNVTSVDGTNINITTTSTGTPTNLTYTIFCYA